MKFTADDFMLKMPVYVDPSCSDALADIANARLEQIVGPLREEIARLKAERLRLAVDFGEAITTANTELIDMRKERDALRAALSGVMSLLDSGYLVRNIDDDHKPDFAIRQMEPILKLKAAVDALAVLAKQGDGE